MTDGPADGTRERTLDRLQALALLLPPFLLAWPGPGSLLRLDFSPAATGAGAAALASLPAAAVLCLRRPVARARGLMLWVAGLLAAAAALAGGRCVDTFEAGRVLLGLSSGLVALIGGASLGSSGRAAFARGTVLASLALGGFALLDRENGFAGALGNTGSTSQAALAGAIVGACFVIAEGLAWRALGGLALMLAIAHASAAPVLAGAATLSGALLLHALARPGLARAVRVGFAALALASGIGAISSLAPGAAGRQDAPSSAPSAGNSGGIEVRARVWRASLGLLAGQRWLGAGPGQFAAQFPPHRDPLEIELSTHGRALGAETEVEHAHNDWLGPVVEGGLLAGAAWVAFLLSVAICAWRALRGGDATLAALGLAALGLLASALGGAPLTANPACAALALPMLGCVLAEPRAGRVGIAARIPALLAAALLAALAPRAWTCVAHARALAPLAREGQKPAGEAARAIDAALEARPDSALALSLRARLEAARGAPPAALREAWERVLAVRPHRFEARMEVATALAESGDLDAARAAYERARALDPGHPGLLRNLAVVELEDGNVEAGIAWLDRLGDRAPEREWLLGLASKLFLRGQDGEGEAVLARADPASASSPAPGADELWARARAERQAGRIAAAEVLECRAHRLTARALVAAGRHADAVRSYRQCLRLTFDAVPGGAPRVRLELAAALLMDGREDEARAAAGLNRPRPRDLGALPPWAGERLRAAGWWSE